MNFKSLVYYLESVGRSKSVDNDAGFVAQAGVRKRERRQWRLLVLNHLYNGLNLARDVPGAIDEGDGQTIERNTAIAHSKGPFDRKLYSYSTDR